MGGIAAVLNLNGSAVPCSDVECMEKVLRPYGPDRQKTWVRENAAFVCCLDAVTPEDVFDRQPLQCADRFILLFDGRLDNRSELGEAVGIPPSELRSMPDSLITLRLWERWSERALERIAGVFAIIVMDHQAGRLICARDPMGLRALHYYHSSKQFAVATVPEALFALSWVPRILNEDKVGDSLVQRGLNGETTYYKHIYRVLPGSSLQVRNGCFSKARFWNAENIPDVRLKSDEDYVEAFKEHLDNAVHASLRSRRPPCSTITGGLDSSSISVIAAEILARTGNKLNTFTAVPEIGFFREETRSFYFDETPYVRRIADSNSNLVPHFIPPSKDPILEQIAQQIRVAGMPTGGVLNGLWNMDIFAAARGAGHDVMLLGEIGNFTMSFDGSPLFAELVLEGRLLTLIREVVSSGSRWKFIIRHHTIAPFIPASIFRRYKQWRRGGLPPWHDFSAINPQFAARSGVIDRADREYAPFDAPPPRDGRLLRILGFHCFCDTADWFARVRAKLRIDLRTPAVDRRLVEFCIGIPQDQYLRDGCDRWLIRRAMKGRLPDLILANKKSGIQSADWYPRLTRERHQIAARIKNFALNSQVRSILDLQKLAAILDHWPEREPSRYDAETFRLFWALPQALGAACFVEDVAGSNLGR